MAKTADNRVEERTGLNRPIPAAMNELSVLLSSRRTTVTQLHPLIAELEADHRDLAGRPTVVQHEADQANSMNGILRLLQDSRLTRFGIKSGLVEELEQTQAKMRPVGHDQV